ncbi:hypothetical protein HK101_004723, partial [Irineochytrium annulatum]
AELIATLLDPTPTPSRISSKRGFVTITGAYHGIPVSIVSIGMGVAMMDFFVREVRAVVEGPMAVIRFGSCGGIAERARVGDIAVVTEGSLMITRNYDHFGKGGEGRGKNSMGSRSKPYNISELVEPDQVLTDACAKTKKLKASVIDAVGRDRIVTGVNATADSFYSSQGRQDPMFDDENSNLIDAVIAAHPEAMTLEMECFMLLHLARCATAASKRRAAEAAEAATALATGAPVNGNAVVEVDGNGDVAAVNGIEGNAASLAVDGEGHVKHGEIYAASCFVVFAERHSGKFIDPLLTQEMETVGGRACLEALVAIEF